jgi:hypothetical protein
VRLWDQTGAMVQAVVAVVVACTVVIVPLAISHIILLWILVVYLDVPKLGVIDPVTGGIRGCSGEVVLERGDR